MPAPKAPKPKATTPANGATGVPKPKGGKSSRSSTGTSTPVPPPTTEERQDTTAASSSGRPDKAAYDEEQEQIKKDIDAVQAKLVCLVRNLVNLTWLFITDNLYCSLL
jgi:hypothetical protein